MSVSVEELFSEGPKYTSVKFPTVGTKFSGVVIEQEAQQQREFESGTPLFWPDGRPKMQVVLTCTDSATGDTVRLYCKSLMLKAAKEAVRAAGLKSFEPGTKIEVAYTGDAPNRAKEYTFTATKGSGEDGVADVLAGRPPAATPPSKADASPPSKVDVSGLPPGALEALRAAGLAN